MQMTVITISVVHADESHIIIGAHQNVAEWPNTFLDHTTKEGISDISSDAVCQYSDR